VGFIEGVIPQSPCRLSVQGEDVAIRQFQFVLWVSLTPTNLFTLPPGAPKFPVLLDTGHNHNFSITEKHLRAWARLEIQRFLAYPTSASINDSSGRQHEAPLYDGCLWLYFERSKRSTIACGIGRRLYLFPCEPRTDGSAHPAAWGSIARDRPPRVDGRFRCPQFLPVAVGKPLARPPPVRRLTRTAAAAIVGDVLPGGRRGGSPCTRWRVLSQMGDSCARFNS